ncbi:MAG: nucleotidyltransferase domain-containing protein [candidate division NC10 bacterium]|nr:nucleotidyltransferase domain-containing protein [candidate division NC10 bacterium]
MKRVARKYGLDLVVLFGSHVSGRARAGSDVDVAVRRQPGRLEADSLRLEVAAALERAFPEAAEVDVVFLNEAGSLLLFQVATTGRALYERQPMLFWQFQSYAARRYDDDYKYRLRRDAYLDRQVKRWNRNTARSSRRS